jgi:outer membrane immunogenic protein
VETKIMKRVWVLPLAAIAVLLGASPNVWAGNGEHGRYLGLRFIGAYAEVQDSKTTNFNGALQINHDDDLVAGNSIILGYRWKSLPLRTEIEVGYRYRFDYDVRDIGTSTGYENNLATVTGLFNAAYEYRNSSDFTPYAGGSIGWAQNNSNVTRDKIGTNDIEKFQNGEHNFAWGGMTGVTWRFTKHWDIDLGYRYINLGEVNTGISSIGTGIEAENHISHDVLFTVNHRF